HREYECRSAAARVLVADRSAVQLRERARDGEPQARPRGGHAAPSAREAREDALALAVVDTRAVVGDGHAEAVGSTVGLDGDRGALRRELDGVVDEVADRATQTAHVR